jgi:hypothetical protein
MLNGRTSTERRSGDGSYGAREVYERTNHSTTQEESQRPSNGRRSTDQQRQRFLGPASRDDQTANGTLAPSPVDGRSARERELSQNMPIRERSRTNGSTNGKSSTGILRICSKCAEPLTGQYVRALGGTFHLECFKCQVSWSRASERADGWG